MTQSSQSFFCFVAHGSTRPRWKVVVKAALDRWMEEHSLRASLYLLNDSTQSFEEYLRAVHDSGENRIEVVPLFVAPGGHVLDDLEAVTERLAVEKAGDLELTVHGTLLEADAIVTALGAMLTTGAAHLP